MLEEGHRPLFTAKTDIQSQQQNGHREYIYSNIEYQHFYRAELSISTIALWRPYAELFHTNIHINKYVCMPNRQFD